MTLNNPEDQKKLKGFVQEAVDSLTREASEKEFRKEVAENAMKELDLDKKTFNNLVKRVYKRDIEKETTKIERVSELYEVATK